MATINRNRHGKLLDRPKTTLHTVGMDIGYGEGTSPGGYKYALTLVDFATRHTWVYGLRTKSSECIIDALWCFYIDAGGFPTRIRCDFDSSFVKGKVYSFLRRKGIRVGVSPPGRQSQNGAVERQWRTATSMARALLVEAKMPKRYWFWALREAIIRMNLLPVKPTATPVTHEFLDVDLSESSSKLPSGVSKKIAKARAANTSTTDTLTTPFELFYGIKPDYRTLFQWGCIGFYRRTRDSAGGRGQFDMHSSVGIAIGRSNHTNGKIFWDPVTQRMNVSADYKLDPTAAIGTHFSTVVYDGQISPLVLRGGSIPPKNHFPQASKYKSTLTRSTTKAP
jgi:transposase InsO family protein